VIFLLAIAIGFAAGLRSMMPLAAVRFPKHDWTSVLFGIFALIELTGDKLPQTPPRTVWYAALWRVITGGYAGGIVVAAADGSFAAGALAGGIGAIIGTRAGLLWRTSVRDRFGGPDIVYALIEDAVSIVLSFGIAR
jgi:uncharacterized membrane protein